MDKQDQLANRFSGLLGTGMSKEDAWKVIAVELLADAGMIAPQQLRPPAVQLGRTKERLLPIDESKVIKVIRVDPPEDDRIRALLGRAIQASTGVKSDAPTESAIIRQALRLGLSELERQNARR